MPMVTVSISPQQAAGIRAAVDTGTYASGSEVVREALRLWEAARCQGDPDVGTEPAGAAARSAADGARSGSRCVADMFADYDAEKRHQA